MCNGGWYIADNSFAWVNVYTCPDNTDKAGTYSSTSPTTTCTCVAPAVENAAHTACEAPPPPLPPPPQLGPPGFDPGSSGGAGVGGGSAGGSAGGSDPGGPPTCSRPPDGAQTGAPIIPATGEKIFTQGDYTGDGAHALSFTRHFRSSWATGAARALASDPGLGQAWAHNHAVSLVFGNTSSSVASVLLGDGNVIGFAWDAASASWKPAFGSNTLTPLAAGAYRLTKTDDDSQWLFDAAGRLVSVTQRNGWVTTYTYSDATTPSGIAPHAGLLIRVSNQFGRFLGFTYNTAGQLASVATPDGQLISFAFDSMLRLSAVGYAGNTSKTYTYEDANWPKSVNGIVDERGIRLATVVYDGQGRATSSGYALGADRYSVAYPASAGAPTAVTDPLGTVRTYSYGSALNKLAVTGASLPSGSGNPDAASRVQNASGLIDSETDFLGVQTLYTWDLSRRLPLSTTKAANKPEAQTTSTQWHATFRLPVLVTEPGRSTASTYDNLGNKLTETVTDTATGAARTWGWAYNPQGLVAARTDPRGFVSSFAYDAAGNLTSTTNALGQATTFT